MTLKIKHKLALALLMTSIVSMNIIATLSYYIAKKTSTWQTFDKLTYIRNYRSQEQNELIIGEFENGEGVTSRQMMYPLWA